MTERTVTIDAQTTENTVSPALLPTPRTPIGQDGSQTVPEPRRASLGSGAVAEPAEPPATAPSAPAGTGAGSSWVEHPLRRRLRVVLRGRPLTIEESDAASRAVAAARLQRIDPVAAQARLFTGLR